MMVVVVMVVVRQHPKVPTPRGLIVITEAG